LYDNIKSCVKFYDYLSDFFFDFFFLNNSGLLQGEVLSPILFSLYVNDCEIIFSKKIIVHMIEIELLNIFLLMYADNMVLLAETPEGLQNF